jgi:flagellar basal-body rod modification protein FlgD
MYADATQSAAAAGATAGPAAKSKDTAAGALGQKEVFLQLLVAQIRNQNPLNPADGIQFVTQLAQFSQLEQAIQMRNDLDALVKIFSPPATDAGGQSQSGT